MFDGAREDTVNNFWQLHTLMGCEKEKAASECQNNNSNTVQERKSYDCHVDVQSYTNEVTTKCAATNTP